MAAPSLARPQVNSEPGITRGRWAILALLLAVTIINFVDRQTLSILAPKIRESMHLSHGAYGRIVAAFQFGMMAGELPVGSLMDRWGVRFGLSLAVLWWSLATGTQAFVRSGFQLAATRFWMGTGECGNYSGGVKTVNQWFPKTERAFAIGIFNGGSMLGAIIAPPLIVWLARTYGFFYAFLLPATLGLLWVPLWWRSYRALHEAKRADDSAGESIPSLSNLLRLRRTWAIMACRFLVGPVAQFYLYWTPDYLYSVRGLSLLEIGQYSWIPFVLGDIGSVSGGWAAGVLINRHLSVRVARQVTMYAGAILCLASVLVPIVPTAPQALGIIGLVLFGHTFLSANMFASVTDMFPDQAVGRVTGLHGLCGGLSGLLFPLLAGLLIDRVSYAPVFALAAAMPLAGTFALFALGRKGD